MDNLKELFQKFQKVRVGVIGDVMLDSYLWGDVNRISPEGPVPVVTLTRKEQRVGGAANVAGNLRALGARAFVLSVFGMDDEGKKLGQLLSDQQINAKYCVRSRQRMTTNKIRVIGRNQQMMRIDAEETDELSDKDVNSLLQKFKLFVANEKPHVIIFEDYNKGVLSEKVIAGVLEHSRKSGIVTAVDPKRKHFFSYKGVDIFKPNMKEIRDAFNYLIMDTTPEGLRQIHADLHARLGHKNSLITLSEKGMYYNSGKESAIIPSHLRNIADVSGAGDTVIAVAALTYAVTKNIHLAADLANTAGGLVCEQVGTAPVDRSRLLHEAEMLLS